MKTIVRAALQSEPGLGCSSEIYRYHENHFPTTLLADLRNVQLTGIQRLQWRNVYNSLEALDSFISILKHLSFYKLSLIEDHNNIFIKVPVYKDTLHYSDMQICS